MEVPFVGNSPQYMSEEAAGADLRAEFGHEIEPGQQVLIRTDTRVALQEGTCGLLMPRSSLCNKKGLLLVNSVGLLDSDYRGELMFCYRNVSDHVVQVQAGERIGQLAIFPVLRATFTKVDDLSGTERGTGGFGSTGSN